MNTQRCTECEELELARVRDALPVSRLEIPEAALAGLPGGRESSALTRRSLLAGGLAGVASVYGARALGFEEVFESAVAQAAPSDQNVLVLIYLAGGNDGLNTLVPADPDDYAAYLAARPGIGRQVAGLAPAVMPGTGGKLQMAKVITAAGNGSSGAHGFDTLYGDGTAAGSDLAVLPAVDYTPSNFSHFTSSDYWFAGDLNATTTGWLGRWIDRNGSATNPLQAISIDQALSKAIRTSVNPVCAIPGTGSMGFRNNVDYRMPSNAPLGPALNPVMGDFGAIPAGPLNTYLGRARKAYGQAVDVSAQKTTVENQPATQPTHPSNSWLSNRLALAARFIGANLGTRVITIHWGGFDTHGDQVSVQDPQLAELSWALSAFKADLTARGVEGRVVTMGFSEFGRRVPENGTGTDHGAGGLMFLSGSAVRGGLSSQFPGCQPSELVDGNVKVTTDFRSVYQAVLTEWLGGDLTGVLPGGMFPALQRQDGGTALFA